METSANTNLDKGRVLAKGFFPVRPPADEAMSGYAYPPQCENAGEITIEQITAQIRKLKPYKAPGPDGIPNIVLTKSADLIVTRLVTILGLVGPLFFISLAPSFLIYPSRLPSF